MNTSFTLRIWKRFRRINLGTACSSILSLMSPIRQRQSSSHGTNDARGFGRSGRGQLSINGPKLQITSLSGQPVASLVKLTHLFLPAGLEIHGPGRGLKRKFRELENGFSRLVGKAAAACGARVLQGARRLPFWICPTSGTIRASWGAAPLSWQEIKRHHRVISHERVSAGGWNNLCRWQYWTWGRHVGRGLRGGHVGVQYLGGSNINWIGQTSWRACFARPWSRCWLGRFRCHVFWNNHDLLPSKSCNPGASVRCRWWIYGLTGDLPLSCSPPGFL